MSTDSRDPIRGALARGVAVVRTAGLVSCVALIPAACESDPSGATDAVVRDSAGITIVESPAALADRPYERVPGETPVVDIGVVDGAPEYQLFRVTSVMRLGDGRLVVANAGTHELRFYDAAGTHLMSTGGRGNGPGEYNYLVLVPSPFADTLVVYDPFQRRFSILTTDGRFVRTITPASRIGNAIGLLDNGRAVATENTARAGSDTPEGMMPNHVVVEAVDLASPVRDTIGTFAGPDLLLWRQGGVIGFTSVPFDVAPTATTGPDRIWVTPGRIPEIHEFDGAGTLLRILRVLREPEPIPREQFDALVAEEVSRAGDDAQAAEFRRRYASMPVREAMPAWDRLLRDSEGNVWARRYKPRESDASTWEVFGEDGVARGSVTLPVGVRLQSVSGNYLITTRRDESDVEHVVVWEMIAVAG